MTHVPFLCLISLFLSHGTDAFPSEPLRHANPPITYKKKAIVVGGGPVGLATALTLSCPPHCMNVTLFEQSTPSAYDPTKAYLYMVNARGQTWTERFPSVQQRLVERGSAARGGFVGICIVPADPEQAIPMPKKLSISDTKMVKESYWIPRHTMTSLLEEVIREQQASDDDKCGSVELCLGKKFIEVETTDDGMLKVTVQNVEDPIVRYKETFTANLVVAADGMNSGVRTFCTTQDGVFLRNRLSRNNADSLFTGPRLSGR
jgi:2-polyprenyl-6-methoxyphenol hydroxylase-like FAD-dependent oxidoreductase